MQRLRVKVERRRPIGALEDRVALVLLLLQLLGLLVDVLGLLVVGRQSQDLRNGRFCSEYSKNRLLSHHLLS